MTLKTWSNFSKKINSTLQPTGASRDYNVYLKENTSIEKPVFILGTGIDSGINYCQCFGNYYFVDDIVMISADQVEVHCTLDVLATHKTVIGGYSAFIERAASAHDQWLNDSAVSANQDLVNEAVATTELYPVDIDGCFIVRTVSPGSSSTPTGIASWIMNKSDMVRFLDFITTDSNFPDVLTDSMVKTFFNPFQYVISIKWFPIAKADIAGTDTPMILGWWQPGTFKLLTSSLYYQNVTLNIPTKAYNGDFREVNPAFTRVIADLPNIGIVELDPALIWGSARVRVCIDWITGEMRLTFGREGTQGGLQVMTDGFSSFSGQIGIDIPVGQSNSMSSQALAAAPDMSTLTAAGAGLVTGAVDIINGIKNILSPTLSIIGGSGNVASIISNPRMLLYVRNYGSGDIPNTVYGRPLCKNRVINTLSGFIKCQGASIALAAPDTETQAVNNFLNSGFYYE